MIARATGDPAAYRDLVFPFLQRDPVLNTSLLTNVADRVGGIMNDPEPPVFVSVHDGGEVVGAAIATALRGVLLAGLPVELVAPVVDVLAEAAPRAQGVDGTADAAQRFAEEYGVRTGRPYREIERSRLHKLEEYVEQTADGTPRLATEADMDVLVPQFGAFRAEVGHATVGAAADRMWVRQRIERQRFWVWEDGGRVVSFVGHQAPVFGTARVGPVCTPPEYRGHGYASALTATVTRRLGESGYQVCLFTDLANPTSNKIYATIGYRPVGDFVGYAFS
ncbi:GNAT family N-acetyltransferase [Kribbella sp.]|uniref:GNAT family N-acetyltransferase n=1 Tax=Kribbella sp. TaxID=1871183 RepID=UPI002D5F700F|nr:GNAT family N-acetyltransferase [Kribbella sp.]HZX03490.1 GNAT family N-acetyltransferase [Kribbella sp.]